MTVKIVILNWNGREYLERFLPSVTACACGAEVFVADNGSTDDSVAFLRERYPAVGVLRLDRNYGYAEGYNRALAELEADYFVLLNSDVQVSEGWLDPLVRMMESDDRIAAVAPKIRSYGEPSRFEYAGAGGGFIDFLGYPFCRGRILGTIETDRGQYDSAREVFWTSGACMLVRASVFRSLGGFDAGFFAHMEEIDFCWRAQLSGYRLVVEPAGIVYHLGGGTLPNNTPGKIYLNYRNNLSMLYKNLGGGFRGILLLRMLLDGLSALVFLVQGKGAFARKVFDAHRDFYRRLEILREQRRAIRSKAVPGRVTGIYRGSILLRYLFGRRTFGRMM